jgi:hypothetical protein
MQSPRQEQQRVVDEDELARLKRDYLPMWAALAYGSAVGKGAPGEVPYVDYMKPGVSMGDADEAPDPWVCNIIEAAILEISPKLPMARAALSVRYLNARGPAVYRSGRLERLETAEIEDLADKAERLLVPVVKRRGLPL